MVVKAMERPMWKSCADLLSWMIQTKCGFFLFVVVSPVLAPVLGLLYWAEEIVPDRKMGWFMR